MYRQFREDNFLKFGHVVLRYTSERTCGQTAYVTRRSQYAQRKYFAALHGANYKQVVKVIN